MTRYYHERFFVDIRFTTVAELTLFVVGFWEVPAAFLLIPMVALLGAVQTAFDASYLIFARQYAARLEQAINERTDGTMLIGAELEEAYLFPLNRPKLVVASLGRDFSWFGFMTLFYTALGVAAYGFGLVLGWEVLADASGAMRFAYLAVLVVVTVAALLVGLWWFVGGEGEGRLRRVLDDRFDPS